MPSTLNSFSIVKIGKVYELAGTKSICLEIAELNTK